MKSKSKKQNNPTILIVDDDLHILEVLEARLASVEFNVFKASTATQAIVYLKSHHIDLMICDMKMPDMSGFNLFEKARSIRPDIPVIFLTAFGNIPDAVLAMKSGAVEYLTKPFDGRELIAKINEIFKYHIKTEQNDSLRNMIYTGESPVMKELYGLIQKVSKSDVNVLILGESGVGKERVAHLIHELSTRKNNPFVVVDCGSTPSSLLESELFGHVKGSFTNAIRDKKGLIEAADEGTLFLDEIGNISHDMQLRLLRFLEDRRIRKIGDIREINVDCRIIAATNAHLGEEIKNGRFREDLYYRLRVVSINIPSLRERTEDIPGLAHNFIESFCKRKAIPMVQIPDKTLELLCHYPWPGNVRELRNTLEGGVVLCQNGILTPEDLHLERPELFLTKEKENDSKKNLSLEESERNTIIRALFQSGGVQKSAAEILGISRRAIHYKIKKYGIEPSEMKH
ncbi:MAG: sigma-54-dependent Fis family transcriptional regulator [Desulfobacterales bacterium]|nr:sigma-54-dependent Fis family transcriptional regulator [Desulfobacterales bacterium]